MGRLRIEEANALIPALAEAFRRIRELEHEVGARANELERLGYSTSVPYHDGPPPAPIEARRAILRARREELSAAIDRIRAIGADPIDLERGQVELDGTLAGASVVFLWQVGESEIGYYRPASGDPSLRVPIAPNRPPPRRTS